MTRQNSQPNPWPLGRDPPGAPPLARATRPKAPRSASAARSLAMLAVAAAVLGSSVAIAGHVVTPTVSNGGELAYVRDFGADAIAGAAAGERVQGAYVAYQVRAGGSAMDAVEDFSSRGRVADNAIFRRIELPDGALTAAPAHAVAVQQFDTGMAVHCWDDGRFAALNGVNAGFAVQAGRALDVSLLAAAPFDVVGASPSQVTLEHDGHRYVLAVLGQGVLQSHGANLRVTLAPGAELRGWIDGEYPATTALMHAEFDHLAAAGPC